MKYVKSLILIVALIFKQGLMYGHPEAHFGIYGIKHCKTISEYQQNYVGQVVKYLPIHEKSFTDEVHFLEAGGSYDKEYTITKISGNDKKMTFILTELNGKKKVKLVVNNQEEFSSSYDDFYCITDNYSIPLLLISKLKTDKENYLGKILGEGSSKLEITNVIIQQADYKLLSYSYDIYPRIVYEITDKNDGKKSYVDATFVENLNELGTEFTNPAFKCKYTVVGISTKRNSSLKMYTVKNSMSGITKEVLAKSASTGAFDDDKSGKFFATLSKVEKPSNASVRYGNTTTVTDKDITKFSYVDNFIDMLIFTSSNRFNFVLKNISDNTLKLVWNEAVFVDVDGSTSKIMHSGIKYSQREGDQPASTIIKGAKLEDIAVPTANVYYDDLLKEWDIYSLYRNADEIAQGQTIRLMLPIQVKDVINEYIFEFSLNYVFDHPEYLAE